MVRLVRSEGIVVASDFGQMDWTRITVGRHVSDSEMRLRIRDGLTFPDEVMLSPKDRDVLT